MNSVNKFKPRQISAWKAVRALGALAVVIAAGSLAADTNDSDVYRVEEDWQLVVGDPDVLNNGPQVTCTISPADMKTAFCAFDINYHTQPDYQPGGLQIHTWDPVDPVAFANSSRTGVMSNSAETVTWTQAMTWSDSSITFQIVNGTSQTWGTFGGVQGGASGELTLTLPTALSNLNRYSPQVSLDNSGVSFASNLVGSLTLRSVRWYDAKGNLLYQITDPQSVHPQD